MKFAFSTLACPTWTIEQVAQTARYLGYQGIELRLLDGVLIDPITDRLKVERAVGVVRAHGVEVCALDASCTFNHTDAHVRAQQVAELHQWIRLAQDVHVGIVRVFGGSGQPGVATDEQSTGWVASALREVAAEAERAAVTVVLETHDAFSSARRVARVLDTVGSRSVAALWDSESPHRMGETVEDVVAALGTRIAHVHVKDARRRNPEGTEWQLVLLGDGEVPVREQVQALAHQGFEGYVSVEWEKKWHPELAEPDIALPQHIAWLTQATTTTV